MTRKQLSGLVLAGLLLSSLIALISGAFIVLEGHLITLLWQTLPKLIHHAWWYTLCISLLGGLVLSTLKTHWGPLPTTAHQAIHELKQTQTVNYHDTFKNLTVALVILAFGAGVGPEAALLGAIVSLSVWQADRLRYFYFQRTIVAAQPGYRRLWWLIAPTGHLQRYRSTHSVPAQQLGAKKKFYALFIVNGLVTFFLLMRLLGHPSFITKMGQSHWQISELWLIFPALAIGLVAGPLYHWGSHLIHRLVQRLPEYLPRTLVGAGIIFLFAGLLPRLLFSGQTFMGLIPQVSGNQSGYLLMVAAVLKLVFLQLCLGTGWIGGDIFPIAFSAILFGFGLAQLFPAWDTLLIVGMVATSLAINLLDSIWVPGIFIALFFPLNLWPVLALVLIVQWGGKRLWKHWRLSHRTNA